MITFEVDAEGFYSWADALVSPYKFRMLVRTMKNVAELIRLETIPLVPLDTSALEQSYEYEVVNSSPFILLGVGFDAVDEDSGFHYARYQHDTPNLHHPRRGEQFYLKKGIRYAENEILQMIESDYLSLFHEGVVMRGRTNIDESLHPRFVFFDLEDWIGS